MYVYVYIIIYIAMYVYIYNIQFDIQPCSMCLRSVHDTAIIFKKLLDLVVCMGVGGGRELRWHVFACGKQLVKLH